MSPVFAAARERLVRKPLDCLAPMRGFRSSSSRGWWCRAGGSFACVGALVPRETVRTVDVDGTRLHYHPIATQVLITLRNSCRMAVFATDRDAIEMVKLKSSVRVLSQAVAALCFALLVLAIPVASCLIATGMQTSTSIAVGAFTGVAAAGYQLPRRSLDKISSVIAPKLRSRPTRG